MSEQSICIRVPGTSANCGPGFDSIGLACTVYNDLELRLKREPGLSIEVTGEGAQNIPCDSRNIVWRSVQYLLRKAGKDKEYPSQILSRMRKQEHGNTETTVTTKFHKHTSMKH